MRLLLLLAVLTGWVRAIDLTVTADFTTDEDVALVFSYTDLLAKCTIANGTVVGFKISSLGSDGTLHIANAASGPWTVAPTAGTTVFAPGQYMRFAPSANLSTNDITMMAVRARDAGGNESVSRSVNCDVQPVNDPIFASSGIFTQPSAPATPVTEEQTYTFTWQQLVDTLAISEADGQPWTLRLTSKLSGRLWTPADVEITSFPHDLAVAGAPGDPAVKWRSDVNVYTKTGEDPIGVFTAVAITTSAPTDTSPAITLSTPVVNDPDTLAPGTPTTMTAMAPFVVPRGAITTFSHTQICALASGTNDYDRVGFFNFQFNGPGGAGCEVRIYSDVGTLLQSRTLPTESTYYMGFGNGCSLQIVVPENASTGMQIAGQVSLSVPDSSFQTAYIPVTFNIPSSSGDAGSGSSGGGGGGCSAGAGLAAILIGFGMLCLRGRRLP